MKTGDLAKQFGVDPRTIRNWVSKFSDFLSAGATDGMQSSFNADDYAVLATVKELSTKRMTYDAIHEQLATGYRIEVSELETLSDPRMVPAMAVEHMIDASQIRLALEQVKSDRDKLTEILNMSNTKIDAMQEKIDEMQAEIVRLNREIGKLEGELEYRRKQDE